MLGSSSVDVKPFGPDQEYVALAIVLAVRLNVYPVHIGLLLPGVGAAGGGLTVTLVVPAGPIQPNTVVVTEYVPEAAVVAAAMLGSSKVDVKLFGPVHE